MSQGTFNLLAIGDVMGKPGRTALREALPRIVNSHKIDFVIANVENAAGGFGVTPDMVEEFRNLGVDCMTSGNHLWDKKEIIPFIGHCANLLRPANFVEGSPGKGCAVFQTVFGQKLVVLNLIGRVFMGNYDCPFRAVDKELKRIEGTTPIVIVDMHAETTSEKRAMGWYLDGRVSAVFGTHTHVQTADEQILPKGTAYITDLGMTGPHHSVIGMTPEYSIQRFLYQMPGDKKVAEGDIQLQGVVIRMDEKTGGAISIERIQERVEERK